MPYKDADKAREVNRTASAKHYENNRDKINANRRAAYQENLQDNREVARERMNSLYATDPEHKERRLSSARARNLWVCYRLTQEEYDTILAFQGGVCAGCNEPPRGVRLAVDHCHKTGRIRGLLCWLCNRSIGLLRDRGTIAARLAAYLMSPTAATALGKETYGLIGLAKYKKVMVYGPPPGTVEKKSTKRKKTKNKTTRKRRCEFCTNVACSGGCYEY